MRIIVSSLLILLIVGCTTTRRVNSIDQQSYRSQDPPITKSLFNDKNSTISEESIQKILDGKYTLPNKLRVSIVKLKSGNQGRYYWSNEYYLKSQQSYLDLFKSSFLNSERIDKVSVIPDILISSNPTFTNIRESAVRTQSDIVVIYSITSDLYSKYKFLSKTDIKAFATTQLIVLDVRTGLIPFSTIVTKEHQSKRQDNELNNSEAANRIKNKAVLLTIEEIGNQIATFLEN